MATPVYLTTQADPFNSNVLYENLYRMVVNSATTTEAFEKMKPITKASNAFQWEKCVLITSLFCLVIAVLKSSIFLYAIAAIPCVISLKLWLQKNHKITFGSFNLSLEKNELSLIYSTIGDRFDHMRQCRELWIVQELKIRTNSQQEIEQKIAKKDEIVLWNKMAEKILKLPLEDVNGRGKLQHACTSFLSKDADRYVEIRDGRYYSRFPISQKKEVEISPNADNVKFPKNLYDFTQRIKGVL